MKILAVEDNPGDVVLLREALRDAFGEHAALESRATLRAALEALGGGGFDAVLLDLSLPDAAGFDGVHRIALDPEAPPIIVLTGLDGPGDRGEEAIRQGADDFLAKADLAGDVLRRMLRYAVERREAQRRLRESERTFRDFAENIDGVVWRIDPRSGALIYASPRFERYWGVSPLELMQDLSPAFEPVLPQDRDRVRAAFERSRETGHLDEEFRLRDPDGEVRWMHAKGFPVRDRAGRLSAVAGIAEDVSDRKNAQEQERLLRDKMVQTEKMNALGQFLAGVAHELNNPLTGVIGYCQLLLGEDKVRREDQLRSDLELVHKESMRCQRIVRSLSTFARQQKPQRERVDLNALVRECLDLERYRLLTGSVDVRLELAEGLPSMMADPGQLQQVVLNLMGNAHHAVLGMAEGGSVRIRTRVRGQSACIEVLDDGPGIPEEVLPHLWEPFFTTKEVGQGTGLGLAICYGIVREHGGTIEASNRAAGGARFEVRIPIVRPRVDGDARKSAEGSAIAPGLRVLLVDDERAVRNLVERVFERSGASLVLARDGEAGRRRLANEEFDAVLCDIKMPGLDGRGLFRWARRHAPRAAARWVFLTGSIGGDTEEFLRASGRPFLLKPFSIEDLARVVRAAAVPGGPGGRGTRVQGAVDTDL